MKRWCCLVLLLLQAACAYDPFDPFQRPGTWVPLGDNAANLRVMVANPHDLIEGAGEEKSLGAEAASPVDRLFSGKRYALPPLNASAVDAFAQQPQGGGGGSPQQ
jgi:hypothetical protein